MYTYKAKILVNNNKKVRNSTFPSLFYSQDLVYFFEFFNDCKTSVQFCVSVSSLIFSSIRLH